MSLAASLVPVNTSVEGLHLIETDYGMTGRDNALARIRPGCLAALPLKAVGMF